MQLALPPGGEKRWALETKLRQVERSATWWKAGCSRNQPQKLRTWTWQPAVLRLEYEGGSLLGHGLGL